MSGQGDHNGDDTLEGSGDESSRANNCGGGRDVEGEENPGAKSLTPITNHNAHPESLIKQ